MSIYSETIQILKKYNITANKSLGQNFLIADDVVTGIVKQAEICKNDLVIEIGPGLGTLTKELLDKANKVICIELDKRMLNILNDRFTGQNIEIINDDILKVDLNELIKNKKNNDITAVKVVANLPYYITTPIIMKLLESKLDIDSITVMVQKEVATRMAATPDDGDNGAITYAIRYYTNPNIVINVPKESFIPAPEVESSVIKLDVLKKPSVIVKSEELLFKVIKLSFMQKRKTLLNSLSNGKLLESKAEIEKMLNDLEIDIKIRPERLTLEEFAKISDYVYNNACRRGEKMNIEDLEKSLNISFKDKKLLEKAFIHKSYAYENHVESNEKLEFLGDAILELVISEYLYKNYNNLKEGEMTKVRASVVCEESLYEVAKKHNFSDFLVVSKNEFINKGNEKPAMLADSVEAFIAALFLDAGLEKAKEFIIDNLNESISIASKNVGMKDYKTVLQEKLQIHGEVKIKYELIKEEGPDHDKLFTVYVACDGKKLAEGKGKTKKSAEMEAAKKALESI